MDFEESTRGGTYISDERTVIFLQISYKRTALRKRNIFTSMRGKYGTTAFYIIALPDKTIVSSTHIFDAFPIPVS